MPLRAVIALVALLCAWLRPGLAVAGDAGFSLQLAAECGAGQRWADDCNQCACGADGKVACTDADCTADGCTHAGTHYAIGDTFMDDCHSCLCNKDGTVACSDESCTVGPGSCTMGNATFAEGVLMTCPDGCNDCGCDHGSWAWTDASCDPLPTIEVCPDDQSTQESPVYLVGAVLSLNVTYGGGCQEHDFKLCYDGTFRESSPVQVALYAIDLNKEDPCDATPTEQGVFDLAPLVTAYEKFYGAQQATILLQAGGQSWPLEFSEPMP